MYNFSVEEFLKDLEVLVNIDSGFGACDGATQTALLLAEPLVQQGWLLERHKVSDQCGECIVLKNREAEHYDVLMVGHTDTVFPAGEALKRPFRRDEKRAYGVGVIDMKQGDLAITYVLRDLPKAVLDKLNIAVVFNPDEEIGSPYSKDLIDSIACRTTYGLVFEGAGGTCTRTIQRKGLMRVHTEFHGKAGHAGYAFTNGGILNISGGEIHGRLNLGTTIASSDTKTGTVNISGSAKIYSPTAANPVANNNLSTTLTVNIGKLNDDAMIGLQVSSTGNPLTSEKLLASYSDEESLQKALTDGRIGISVYMSGDTYNRTYAFVTRDGKLYVYQTSATPK